MQNLLEITQIIIEIEGEEVVHQMSKFEFSELSNYYSVTVNML